MLSHDEHFQWNAILSSFEFTLTPKRTPSMRGLSVRPASTENTSYTIVKAALGFRSLTWPCLLRYSNNFFESGHGALLWTMSKAVRVEICSAIILNGTDSHDFRISSLLIRTCSYWTIRLPKFSHAHNCPISLHTRNKSDHRIYMTYGCSQIFSRPCFYKLDIVASHFSVTKQQ